MHAHSPATAILNGALEADLVVVGARGYGGFEGLHLGSVAHQVVNHARCPVAVFRPRHS
ncbi:universal stress protein [Arthrobacter sp. ATA002]|uniref:universal stress protein n=1 Tax=Arthrobacter sp. ATA002 TaxID=2991715 RepID=UPI0022A6C792|nr:universal stress protein [Arthrobacter sp. ATA002]WAP53390.1 universal stress protein [Arthrobacter sp. ATA002]